ncbi:FecR domain-containing protein [Pseudomonas entomophila]|uniref:FecR family protein n=1 Tax=Pseudomonas entomophila TaxID=312306 RepID=UPI0023D82E54|nr:FecR domain-containing protein [Pseudomonas entomophila]MDF0731391.1 FecR domain-containing protein [Pseudomonas entomophila]
MSDNAEQRIFDEAAQWLALLDSGHISTQEARAFEQWQARDPRHARCIQAVTGQVSQLRGAGLQRLDHEHLLKTLEAPPASRRAFIRKGAGLLGVTAAALLVARLRPDDWLGLDDLATGTAQRRQLRLPDGSELLLNARSRVTPSFDSGQRQLTLREGELQVGIAGGQPRPLRIQTPAGVVSSLDARLQVRLDDQQTRVLVLSANAELITQDGQRRALKAGQGAWFDGRGQLAVHAANPDAQLWVRGLVKVHDEPLGQVIDALRSYRRGIIRLSPEAARLRVSGIYSLDDTRKTLLALRDSLGLNVDFYTDYWVNIEAADRPHAG